ncbi:MAG: transposase, partial [Albidovulum sp.]|nr:transposase [Albidovulum sp.]
MSDIPKHDDMEVRHAAAAGLDVRRMQVTATVRTHAGREAPVVETREFSALASGLVHLVQWLSGLRVSGAVMGATGVYWEKVYDILSDAGLDVMVVNAQHVKQIKGPKTDVADSVWLSRICQCGLGSPSLVLPKIFRDLRGLSRYRRALIEPRARSQLRIQKVLDRGGVRIGGILSRITHSVNGRRILEGIIAGEECEDILGGLSWHVRKKLSLLADALSFELDMQSRWILSALLAQFDSDAARIEAANRRMEAALASYEALVRLLETLPGAGRESAMAILVELGPDMSVFAS